VNIRIISLALHRIITIGILPTHILNLDLYPLDKLEFRQHTCFPMDTILGILPGEIYFDTCVLADIVSVCLHRCQQVF
jgi:hypothetical protein